jgi:hypothetical protein
VARMVTREDDGQKVDCGRNGDRGKRRDRGQEGEKGREEREGREGGGREGGHQPLCHNFLHRSLLSNGVSHFCEQLHLPFCPPSAAHVFAGRGGTNRVAARRSLDGSNQKFAIT